VNRAAKSHKTALGATNKNISMRKERVVITGAGLVGSLWAIFLAKKGYQVQIFERRPDMRAKGYLGGRSINLAMSARGWKAAERAGIKDRLEQVGIPLPGRMIHDIKGNTTFQAYGKDGQAIWSVSRGGLNLALLEIAGEFENVHINFEEKCTTVDLDRPLLHFEHERTKQQSTIEADLIFGTDGAFSAVRYAMQRTDRFDYKQHYLAHGYKELTIPAGPNGSFLIEKNALHIWPRGNFMLMAMPNHDGSFTMTLYLPFEGEISFASLQTDEQIIDFFQTWFPDAVAMMPDLLVHFRGNPTASLVTVQCSPWQWQERMLLLGDSAHAIVPFYGQGMNAGFEDCTILDEMIDAYDHDWTRILGDFSDQHSKNGHAIAELAQRNFIEMRDKVGDPMFMLRKKITAQLQAKYPDWLSVYSQVTFSDTPYSKALQADDAENELFAKILKLPNITENWQENGEVDRIFGEWRLVGSNQYN
jgi:kynurenine 3-monooxygenase